MSPIQQFQQKHFCLFFLLLALSYLQASFAKKPKPKLQCPDFNIKPPPALTEVQGICKCTWAFNVSENKMFVINIIQKGPGMPKAKGKAQPEASLILPDGTNITLMSRYMSTFKLCFVNPTCSKQADQQNCNGTFFWTKTPLQLTYVFAQQKPKRKTLPPITVQVSVTVLTIQCRTTNNFANNQKEPPKNVWTIVALVLGLSFLVTLTIFLSLYFKRTSCNKSSNVEGTSTIIHNEVLSHANEVEQSATNNPVNAINEVNRIYNTVDDVIPGCNTSNTHAYDEVEIFEGDVMYNHLTTYSHNSMTETARTIPIKDNGNENVIVANILYQSSFDEDLEKRDA
ncbi:uncharacterized protein LOC143450167 isoform X2 [Clavelina lepadiformis]|uniref:uncharacterized protein LOC143450167 isoform X2 n=1 Tax=Clavelina lepadiformis TaxID=159417 RepID=UPI0040419990